MVKRASPPGPKPPSPKISRGVGRPRDQDKALAILDAGWALFLARGIEGTSVESIAAAAGVSKVTLYSRYPDKAALFEAAARREMERIEAAQALPAPQPPGVDAKGLPLPDRLRVFGLGLMRFLLSKPAIDFYAVVAGELRRHETLARAFHDLGPGRTRANLAALLADAARRGELAPLDPGKAADELFGLWQGFTNFQLALGVDVEPIRADLPARVERGIAVFLRAYGATAPG